MDLGSYFLGPKKEGFHGYYCTFGFHCWLLHWWSLGALQLCGWSTNLTLEDSARANLEKVRLISQKRIQSWKIGFNCTIGIKIGLIDITIKCMSSNIQFIFTIKHTGKVRSHWSTSLHDDPKTGFHQLWTLELYGSNWLSPQTLEAKQISWVHSSN
jgi:hypothetical protein